METSREAKAEILIIGASGLVGGALLERLGPRAAGTSRAGRSGLLPLDITDREAVARTIERLAPRAVVLAAALTAVDECERDPERSRLVNAEAPRQVAEACRRAGARLVFFSSDYVFGEGGPHSPDDEPAPLNVYGRHKLEAERAIATAIAGALIVRTCNVYGYAPAGKNFAMSVLRAARCGQRLRVAADQFGNPTAAGDLAAAVVRLLEAGASGIVHLAGPDYVDRATWAHRTAEAFGLDPSFIEPVPAAALGQAARRPLRAGLDARSTCERFGLVMRGLDEGLAAMREAARQRT